MMNTIAYAVRAWLYDLRTYPAKVLGAVKSVLKSILVLILRVLGPIILPPFSLLCLALHRYTPRLWQWLLKPMFIRKLVTRLVIFKFGNVTKPRPHPFSMQADYPTWTGFVDLTFTGRHLGPETPRKVAPVRPGREELEELFLRPAFEGAQVDCSRSNLLFACFAQWFTDSFLRTSHKLKFENDNPVKDTDGTWIREPHRERKNNSNHEIDLCQIYGMNRTATDILRFRPGDPGFDPAKHKGMLKCQMIDGQEFPVKLLKKAPDAPKDANDKNAPTELSVAGEFLSVYESETLLRTIFTSASHNPDGYTSLFACGLEHGNSTIGNSLFNTIFLRHHNYVARRIAAAHPALDNDEVFEKARNVMIVLLLKIVICDYVRHISPLNLPFTVIPNAGKNQNWHRRNRIHIEFNLLYRWHSLIPDVFPFLPHAGDVAKNFGAFRHNNQWLIDQGLSNVLQHMAATPAGKMTLGNTPRALQMVKRDTLKLMRAANLKSYNDYRERFSLHRVRSFEELTGEKVIAAALSDLYDGKIDDLEYYIGLVAERHGGAAIMGDLMLNMVAHDALTHALTNPLLAEEMHIKLPGHTVAGEHVFSKTGKEIVDSIETLDDLLRNVVDDLPKDPIVFRKPDPAARTA